MGMEWVPHLENSAIRHEGMDFAERSHADSRRDEMEKQFL